MTTEQIRELDAWIAENVMGWKIHCRNTALYVDADKQNLICEQYHCFISEYKPTTDPAAAMEVLKKCQQLTDVLIYKTVQEKNGVRDDILGMAVDGDTLELAICLFAKKLFTK